MNNDINPKYSIMEYSDKSSSEIEVASFTISDDSIMNIICTADHAQGLTKNGLRSSGLTSEGLVTFQLDLNEAPIEVIAIALGLPGQSPEFRATLSKANDGFVSSAHVLNLALEGHFLQSGRIDNNSSPARLIGINIDSVADLDEVIDSIPVLPGVLGAMRESESDMHVQNLMARKGHVLIPAYIVTSAQDSVTQNLTDRLAIMTAYLEEASKVNGTKSDKILKVGVLDDGRAYAIFSDATRANVKIQSIEQSARDPRKTLIVAKKEDLYAKRGIELNPGTPASRQAAFATHYQASALRQVVEDRIGIMPNPVPYLKEAGSAYATLPRVWGGVTIESLYAMKQSYDAGSQRGLEIAQRQAGITPSGNPGLTDTVKGRISAVARTAFTIRDELDVRVQARIENKAKREGMPERFYSSEVSLSR
jgi:hypothetical protein